MPLTDEEAIALAVLDGMEVYKIELVFSLVDHQYQDAPLDLKGVHKTHGDLAQIWCAYKGLS